MVNELKTIRLSEKASKILNVIPEKTGISKNRFINECIEAHNIPTSRRNKKNYANQIIALTNLSLMKMSTEYKHISESLKQTYEIMERSVANDGNFKNEFYKGI